MFRMANMKVLKSFHVQSFGSFNSKSVLNDLTQFFFSSHYRYHRYTFSSSNYDFGFSI